MFFEENKWNDYHESLRKCSVNVKLTLIGNDSIVSEHVYEPEHFELYGQVSLEAFYLVVIKQ